MVWTERLCHFHDILWAHCRTLSISLLSFSARVLSPSPQVVLTTLFVLSRPDYDCVFWELLSHSGRHSDHKAFLMLIKAPVSYYHVIVRWTCQIGKRKSKHTGEGQSRLKSVEVEAQQEGLKTTSHLNKLTDKLRTSLHKLKFESHVYLGWFSSHDDPGTVGIVVILDGVVWRCDGAARPSQLPPTHRCYERVRQKEENVRSVIRAACKKTMWLLLSRPWGVCTASSNSSRIPNDSFWESERVHRVHIWETTSFPKRTRTSHHDF